MADREQTDEADGDDSRRAAATGREDSGIGRVIPILVACPCDLYPFAHYHSREFDRISSLRFDAGGPPISKEEWQRYLEDQF